MRIFKIQTTNVFSTKSYNKRKDGKITKPLRIQIKRKDSIFKFYEQIGFDDKHKQAKLEKIINMWR